MTILTTVWVAVCCVVGGWQIGCWAAQAMAWVLQQITAKADDNAPFLD
jgi:hypothetical protein